MLVSLVIEDNKLWIESKPEGITLIVSNINTGEILVTPSDIIIEGGKDIND